MRTLIPAVLTVLLAVSSPRAESSKSATAHEHASDASATAVAVIEARSGSQVSGRATFVAKDGKVTMSIKVLGLEPGTHAFHLHEKGDCSAPDASSAGGHWNPSAENHGKWGTHPFHHGDMGNLEAGPDGTATATISTDLWTVGGPPGTDVLGKALIIHAKADDFTTQPTGNAGGRIGCGVIGKGGKTK